MHFRNGAAVPNGVLLFRGRQPPLHDPGGVSRLVRHPRPANGIERGVFLELGQIHAPVEQFHDVRVMEGGREGLGLAFLDEITGKFFLLSKIRMGGG